MMADEGDDRNSSGRYTEHVSDAELLAVLRSAETPVLTAADVARELPISRKQVGQRLRDLHDAGRVGRYKAGARAVVWWVEEQ